MPEKPRFTKAESLAGAWYIKDNKDGSLVAIVQNGKRPQEHTEAMIKIMLDALNGAVEKRNGATS